MLARATCTKYISPSFVLPKPEQRGFRLITDLRRINKHLRQRTVRYETLRDLPHLLQPKDYLLVRDLTKMFYTIPVHRQHRKFLTTRIGDQLLSYQALPMGLATSPYVAQKIMRCVLQTLRAAGCRTALYVDDWLFAFKSHQEATHARDTLIYPLFTRLGLELDKDKGNHEPSQQVRYLGLIVDTQRGLFAVPKDKLQKMSNKIKKILTYASNHRRCCPVRDLAAIAGTAVALSLAVAPARLAARSLFDLLRHSSKGSWSRTVRLSRQAIRDLRFFQFLDQRWTQRALFRPAIHATMYTDASDSAWGGYAIVRDQTLPAQGMFSARERQLPICAKELRAVRYTINHIGELLAEQNLHLHIDNQVALYTIRRTCSKVPYLTEEYRQLWMAMLQHDIQIARADYISTHENTTADQLSRPDPTDYSLRPTYVQQMVQRYGRFTVDRFASRANAITRRFNSRVYEMGCEATDAFSCDWSRERNWLMPPWRLMARVVRKLHDEPNAEAVLFAPLWPAALWWPTLQEISDEHFELPPASECIVSLHPTPEPTRNPRWRCALFHVPARSC